MATGEWPVLVLCARGLPGLVRAVPALRMLRRAYPGRPLLLAAPAADADLLRENGIVDGVVPTAGLDDAPPGLRLPGPVGPAHHPHTAVNLHDAGPRSHRLLLAGGPADVLWFACTPPPGAPDPGWGLDSGPLWDDAEDDVRRWCRLVATAGAPSDPADRVLPARLREAVVGSGPPTA